MKIRQAKKIVKAAQCFIQINRICEYLNIKKVPLSYFRYNPYQLCKAYKIFVKYRIRKDPTNVVEEVKSYLMDEWSKSLFDSNGVYNETNANK